MTPSLFSQNGVAGGNGEWQFCQQLGKQRCQQVLEAHWDSWVSQSDLQTLYNNGITHLRVPVGYWIVSIYADEPYVTGGWKYLTRLLGWAEQIGLKVVVDLHGAPGSQNGHDNSGKSGPIDWPQPANVARTVDVLGNLTRQLKGYSVVTAIEVLNEPWTPPVGGPIPFSLLKSFYMSAYSRIRAQGFGGDIWISDGWDNDQWQGFMSPPNYNSVYLDVHLYHCFGGPRDKSDPWANIDYTCQEDKPLMNSPTFKQRDWSIIGEWSNSVSKPPPSGQYDDFVSNFARAQWNAYGASGNEAGSGPAKGAFFWNFKIESGDPAWSYLDGIKAGAMPSNFNFEYCH